MPISQRYLKPRLRVGRMANKSCVNQHERIFRAAGLKQQDGVNRYMGALYIGCAAELLDVAHCF